MFAANHGWTRPLAVQLVACFLVMCSAAGAEEVIRHQAGVVPLAPLDDAYLRLSQAYASGDVDAAAAVYEADALYLQPDEEVRRGRWVIEDSVGALFQWASNKGYELRLRFEILEREVFGDFAYDVGYYELTRLKNGVEHGSSRVKFVLVAHADDDGQWRFAVDAFSRSPKR